MDIKAMKSMLKMGETVAVEFKRCGNGIGSDTYESVCSFLNRFGGDIFLGVSDDGTVIGIPSKAAVDMIKNFIRVISDPALFTPTVYLMPEILEYEGKTLIHIHIPPSAEVHSYKKVIYDRVDDSDVKVTATSQIAAMYIRKQDIYTEKRIYPYTELDDLRMDLLPQIRMLAVNRAGGSHPWENMDDMTLLKSAGCYSKDRVTGQSGFNLAAILLLGKDDVIQDVCPQYVTDAIVRRVNVDRYDDREIVRTNLIQSYERLMDFAVKHLPDKFYLEGTDRFSLRNAIAREMLANTLIHREFTSSYTAKFIIEKDKMYVENAHRASREGFITPDNLEPNPKNPIISGFFRIIGRSDQLGSGVRNLFKFTKLYSGCAPVFQDGDVFRIIVPLNENYSFATDLGKGANVDTKDTNVDTKDTNVDTKDTNVDTKDTNRGISTAIKDRILDSVRENPSVTQGELCEQLHVSVTSVKRAMKDLQTQGRLERIGSNRKGYWKIKDIGN